MVGGWWHSGSRAWPNFKGRFFAPLRFTQNDSNRKNVILSAAKDLLFVAAPKHLGVGSGDGATSRSQFTIHYSSVAKIWVFKINTKRGWEFDQYFRSRARGPVQMGDEGWIKSASSLRYLREEAKKGDLFLCYETDRKQIVGVARAASDGRERDLMRKVSLIDFCPPREAVRLENPLTRYPDLDHILAFTPHRGRGTIQPIDRDEFARLRRIMFRKNPSQVDALKRILD